MRIWHQSMTELHELGAYKASLESHASKVLEPDQIVEVHGLPKGAYRGRSPTAALSNAFAHHRILDPVLDSALHAERHGFDAFVLGSYSEPFLRELRSAIDIPIMSVTEATLLVACSVGRLAAPVSNDPAMIDSVPVVDSFGVTWAYAAMMVNLRSKTGLSVSRRGDYQRDDVRLISELGHDT